MKKEYLKPEVEYIRFYSQEDLTAIDIGGNVGGIGSVVEGDKYEDWE